MEKTLEKKQTAEEVQWENKIAYHKSEYDRLVKAKETLQAEIDKKSSEYTLFVGQKDAESKKVRQDALDAQQQLAADKAEFQKILQAFQAEKQGLIETVKAHEADKVKNAAEKDNIRQFIIAVQRASSLLNL